MICWMVILGLLMGWLSPETGGLVGSSIDSVSERPDEPTEADTKVPGGALPDIPEHLRRLPAVAEAEKIVSRR